MQMLMELRLSKRLHKKCRTWLPVKFDYRWIIYLKAVGRPRLRAFLWCFLTGGRHFPRSRIAHRKTQRFLKTYKLTKYAKMKFLIAVLKS